MKAILFVNEPYHEDMKKGYAWHISDLVIFDKPKELRDFRNFNQWNGNEIDPYTITKAPQSWCYCEEVLE